MKNYCWLLIAGWLLSQCTAKESGSSTGTTVAEDTSATDSLQFFPVTAFLQAQINQLDSMPVTILQIARVGDRLDSTWISTKQLKPQLQPFTEDTIEKRNLVKLFRENRFNDQSTESVTLTYLPRVSPLPETVRLRRWDVYVHPESGQLKMVYISRQLIRNGEPVTQQLIWKTGQWAKLVTAGTGKEGTTTTAEEIKWIWGNDN
jgi:hypothetical protein